MIVNLATVLSETMIEVMDLFTGVRAVFNELINAGKKKQEVI